jgi:hypothetical protein
MKVLFSLLAAVMHSAFGSFNPLDHDDSEYPDEFVAAGSLPVSVLTRLRLS